MKHLKFFSLTLATIAISLFILIACDKKTHVDYINQCNFYLSNESNNEIVVEIEMENTFHKIYFHDKDSIIRKTISSNANDTILNCRAMPPTTWLEPSEYLNYLLITSKNGDTLVYEKPINNKNWTTEEFNPFPDGTFVSKNFTYTFK